MNLVLKGTKNVPLTFYISLVDQSNTKLFKASPTLAAGDVKVSIDGGAEANITTLATNTPSGSKRVKVQLSAAEMSGDNISVMFSDAAGAEWCDFTVDVETADVRILHAGTCQHNSSTANIVVLDSGASSTNDWYVGSLFVATSGPAAGLAATILDYDGPSRAAVLSRLLPAGVQETSTFVILAADGIPVLLGSNVTSIASAVLDTFGTFSVTGEWFSYPDSIFDYVHSIKGKTDGLNFTGTDVKATLDSEQVTLTSATITSIWDKLIAGFTTVGSIGKWLVDKLTPATLAAVVAGASGPDLEATIEDFVCGDDIKITRTIANIPALDSAAKAWLTVKKRESYADADAVFQKSITPSYVTGQGHITDDGASDQIADLFFELTAANTSLMTGDTAYYYDIQVKTLNGAIYTPEKGTITGRKPVTLATS